MVKKLIFLLIASGFPVLEAATTTVLGNTLQATFNSSQNGDTIIVPAGTYTVDTGEPYFHIDQAITVVGQGGTVTLEAPSGSGIGLAIRGSNISVSNLIVNGGVTGVNVGAQNESPISGITLTNLTVNPSTSGSGHGMAFYNASNVTVDSCTVGPSTVHGIYVTAPTGSTTTNVLIRNTTVQQAGAGSGILIGQSNFTYLYNDTVDLSQQQHGIYFSTASYGTIEACTVVQADVNGIFLDLNSNNNLVMSNTVQQTETGHAFAVKDSNYNELTGNTVTGSGFHAFELIGAAFNRVEKNQISGQKSDGIVITPGDTVLPGESAVRQSQNNYLAKNHIVSNGLAAGRTSGTGIWLNDGSNGTYVFGNSATGVPEAGLTSFNSSSSYIRGNELFGNGEAGILWWNADSASGFAAPTNTVFHYNYSHDNPTNGNILFRGAVNSDVGYNFFSGTNVTASPKTDGGIVFQNWTQNSVASGGSSNTTVYLNTIKDVSQGAGVEPGTTGAIFFENRFINAGLEYSISPAGVQWDASRFLGGNYWTGSAANGNPSNGAVTYNNFVIDAAGDLSTSSGPYVDKFPYASTTLGMSGTITVVQPVAGQVAAAGSLKTIAWKSQGCVFVNITYTNGGAPQTIATNYPDYGYYHWTVPTNLPAGSNYAIQLTCLDGSGTAFGSGGTSGTFIVGTADLVLLAPGPDLMVNAGATIKVGWRKSASTGAVNVLMAYDGGAWNALASNVSAADYVDVTLPGGVNSNRVQFMVQAANNVNMRDETDGYCTIRGGSAKFTNPNINTGSVLIGSVVELEWISPQNSYSVNLVFWDSSANMFRPLATGLPDYGKLTCFVPEYWMTGSYVQATFWDASGNSLGSVSSPAFNIFYTDTAGSLIPLYRLYSNVTKEHLYSTDENEYNVLGTEGWSQEGIVGQLISGPNVVSAVQSIPYYRLYNAQILNHLWTTDRNEYFTLRLEGGWHAEGVIGYIMPSSVADTVSFTRLVYNWPPYYHLWTTDPNEVSVLSSGGGWTIEGVVGYLFTTSATLTGNDLRGPAMAMAVPAKSESASGRVESSSAKGATAAAETPGMRKERAAPVLEAVLNGASRKDAGAITPGETVHLVGSQLGPDLAVTAEVSAGRKIPNDTSEARVYFDEISAPVLFASSDEIRAIVPKEVNGRLGVRVKVEYGDLVSNEIDMRIAESAPGLFTADGSGTGQIAAVNREGGPNSAINPAVPGSEVAFSMTGEGMDYPVRDTGLVPSAGDVSRAVLPVTADIGGEPAEVLFVGSAPGLPGSVLVRVRVPYDAQAGSQIPIWVSVGSVNSQPGVTIAVKAHD
jgi:uncharacterized protein (TIGR03437 family)